MAKIAGINLDWERLASSVLVGGAGGPIFRGAMKGFLNRLDIERLLFYIQQDRDLLDFWGDDEWAKVKSYIKRARVEKPEEEFVNLLSETRPDLMDVILNEPGGVDWMKRQIENIKVRLGDERHEA